MLLLKWTVSTLKGLPWRRQTELMGFPRLSAYRLGQPAGLGCLAWRPTFHFAGASLPLPLPLARLRSARLGPGWSGPTRLTPDRSVSAQTRRLAAVAGRRTNRAERASPSPNKPAPCRVSHAGNKTRTVQTV